MKYVLIILVTLMPAICVAETLVLTLDQAVTIAMDKNRDIEKAREYASYVQGKYVEERAAALPQLSLNASTLLTKDASQAMTGTMAQRQFVRAVDVTLSQPLYTWGKVNAAIRAAGIGLKTADEQLRLYRQAAYRDVVIAYHDIQLAREMSHLAQENRSQKQRHLDEARRKFGAGVATDYDVLSAEVACENAMPEVIRFWNSIRMARERLRFLLAVGAEEVDVTGSLDDPPPVRSLPTTFGEAFDIAGKRRPELTDLHLRIGIYDELVTIAAAENKPRLDLKGGVGWHWLTINNPGLALDADGAAWNVGLYATFPFFDGLRTNGKVAQARSDLHSKQIEESKLMDSIALDVRQAQFSYYEAGEILKALSGTVKQAGRLVEMAEKGYEFGVKIKLEVDDAQLNLLQARSNQARAQRDFKVAQVNYLWSLGVLDE